MTAGVPNFSSHHSTS